MPHGCLDGHQAQYAAPHLWWYAGQAGFFFFAGGCLGWSRAERPFVSWTKVICRSGRSSALKLSAWAYRPARSVAPLSGARCHNVSLRPYFVLLALRFWLTFSSFSLLFIAWISLGIPSGSSLLSQILSFPFSFLSLRFVWSAWAYRPARPIFFSPMLVFRLLRGSLLLFSLLSLNCFLFAAWFLLGSAWAYCPARPTRPFHSFHHFALFLIISCTFSLSWLVFTESGIAQSGHTFWRRMAISLVRLRFAAGPMFCRLWWWCRLCSLPMQWLLYIVSWHSPSQLSYPCPVGWDAFSFSAQKKKKSAWPPSLPSPFLCLRSYPSLSPPSLRPTQMIPSFVWQQGKWANAPAGDFLFPLLPLSTTFHFLVFFAISVSLPYSCLPNSFLHSHFEVFHFTSISYHSQLTSWHLYSLYPLSPSPTTYLPTFKFTFVIRLPPLGSFFLLSLFPIFILIILQSLILTFFPPFPVPISPPFHSPVYVASRPSAGRF